jgi:hypothetical protein
MSGEESIRNLQGLLLNPVEDLDLEFKGWLSTRDEDAKADIAQALLALANHGGGYLVFGFLEAHGTWIPDEANRPATLADYNTDRINGLVSSYAEPPFHCMVHQVLSSTSGRVYPIVAVPGGSVPIRARRDGPERRHVRQHAYYIRRPGPKSERIQTAQEWDTLIRRCIVSRREALLDDLRAILAGVVNEQPPKSDAERLNEWEAASRARLHQLVIEAGAEDLYRYGTWSFSYALIGDFQAPALADLYRILERVKGNETGWPPWVFIYRDAPRAYEEALESWIRSDDAAHSDFWRVSRTGFAFLLRGYQEDSEGQQEPGTIFDFILPVWRLAECMLHAQRLASALSPETSPQVAIKVTWTGLGGRMLTSWADRHWRLDAGRQAFQDTITTTTASVASEIGDRLPELVRTLTLPLYELFGLFRPPDNLYTEEIKKLRRGG